MSARDRFGRLAIILLGAAPFLLTYCKPFLTSPTTATGFLVGDMPYYMANARAIFERGNGFLGPNAYDPNPNSPAIYFHWLIWICGALIVHCRVDPGILLTSIGLVGGVLCSWATLLLVEVILPDWRYRKLLYFATMWGGGFLCLGKIVCNLSLRNAWNDDLFAFDPFHGWWFQNWGRNIVYPTEALYHAFAAFAFLAFLKGKNHRAILLTAIVAGTHPFTGLQLLLIAAGWLLVLVLTTRTFESVLHLAAIGIVTAIFGWYYFIYLESFEAHRDMRVRWSVDWYLPWSTLALGYLPIALLAIWRLRRIPANGDRKIWFLLLMFIVSLLLSKHELLISPRQPIHFTRGYAWLPLCLIALPLLQRMLIAGRERFQPTTFAVISLCASLLWISDNLFFVGQCFVNPAFPEAHSLRPKLRAMFAFIEQSQLRGVVMAPDRVPRSSGIVCDDVCYLSAVYTPLRPYFGHRYNTPMHMQKQLYLLHWFMHESPAPRLSEMPDYLLFPSDMKPPIRSEEWNVIHQNGEWTLLQRVDSPGI